MIIGAICPIISTSALSPAIACLHEVAVRGRPGPGRG
jgi:hypothetical protein